MLGPPIGGALFQVGGATIDVPGLKLKDQFSICLLIGPCSHDGDAQFSSFGLEEQGLSLNTKYEIYKKSLFMSVI